jgi:drug/metabolite transporter (DMT)-like permease
MKSQRKAYLFAFSAIGCWSTIGSAFKITLRYTDPAGLLLISSLVASVVIGIIMLVQGKTGELRSLTIRQLFLSAMLGLLNPFLYYIVLLKAYDILPAQMAGTLNYIWPLVLVILSVFILKQKISAWSMMAIMISFAGILIISFQPERIAVSEADLHMTGGPGKTAGILLAVGSALFWALYWIFNVKDQRETVSKLFLNFCFGLFYTLIFILLNGGIRIHGWQAIAGGIYIGVFEMGLTFVLWLFALQYSTTTAKVSNLIYLSPFISLIFIHFAVGEAITIATVAGLALIVGGILVQQYLRR